MRTGTGKKGENAYDTLPEYKYNSTAASDLAIGRTSYIDHKELLFSNSPLSGEEYYLDNNLKSIGIYKNGIKEVLRPFKCSSILGGSCNGTCLFLIFIPFTNRTTSHR